MDTHTSKQPFPIATLSLWTCVVIAIIGTAIGLLTFPTQIPLLYSLSLPEQQLVPKVALLTYPVSILLITLIHTQTLKTVTALDSTLKRLFLYATVLVTFLLTLSLIRLLALFL